MPSLRVQFFMFINVKTKQVNTQILPTLESPSTTFPELDQLPERERNIVFDFVAEENGWDFDDEIIAVGNYGDVFFRTVSVPAKIEILKTPPPPNNGQPSTTGEGASR